MHPSIEKAIHHLRNADYANYFGEMDEIVPAHWRSTFSELKGKFIAGLIPWNFSQQLDTFTQEINKELLSKDTHFQSETSEVKNSINMNRNIEELNKLIQESYELLRSWQEKQLLAENPSEEKRAENAIIKLRQKIKEYEEELSTTPSKNSSPSPKTNKEEILKIIDQDIDKAFELLDEKFLDDNAIYRDLVNEFISRPGNFNMSTFRSKLKRFVSMYMK